MSDPLRTDDISRTRGNYLLNRLECAAAVLATDINDDETATRPAAPTARSARSYCAASPIADRAEGRTPPPEDRC